MAQPLFDYKTFSYEQAAGLTNTPGQSLAQSNSASQLLAAQKLSPNIPIGKINPADPLGIKNPEPTPDMAAAIVAGAEADIAAKAALLEGGETDLDKEVDEAEDKYSKDLEGLEGRGQAQLDAEAKAGLADKEKSLTALDSQIANLSAQFNNLIAQNQGRVASMSSITGADAQIRRQMAAEIGGLSAMKLAAQGDVDRAQKEADRAVDLKYEDIETKLKIQREQLDLLTGKLTKEEKLRADAVKLYLDEKADEAAEAKANDKTFNTVKINALGNGMPVSVAQKAQTLFDAGRTDEAYALMAGYDSESSGSSGRFTKTQMNSGSNNAGVSLEDFNRMDEDTQNWFINSSSAIKSQKAEIDKQKKGGADPRDLEDQIQGYDIPEEAKNTLVSYLQHVFAEEYEEINNPAPEEESGKWWKFGFD